MLDRNKVHFMDVLDGMKKIEDSSADVVLVDPPYNIGKDFGTNKCKLEMKEYVEWSKKWMKEAQRIVKDSGTVYIYGFSEILAHLSVNLELEHRWLIWHYTNKTVPSSRFWQRSHESIIVAWKTKDRTFNRDDVREPYTETYIKGYSAESLAKEGKKPRTRPVTEGRFQGKNKTTYKVNDKGALPRDVIKVSALAGGAGASQRWFLCRDCDKVFPPSSWRKHKKEHKDHETIRHPTQKPYELTKRLLLAAKPKENGLVVIPFIGSGAEALVASDVGMDFVGFEINPEYKRLAEESVAENMQIKLAQTAKTG